MNKKKVAMIKRLYAVVLSASLVFGSTLTAYAEPTEGETPQSPAVETPEVPGVPETPQDPENTAAPQNQEAPAESETPEAGSSETPAVSMPIAFISSENIISTAPAVEETSPADVAAAITSADTVIDTDKEIIVTEFSQEQFNAISGALDNAADVFSSKDEEGNTAGDYFNTGSDAAASAVSLTDIVKNDTASSDASTDISDSAAALSSFDTANAAASTDVSEAIAYASTANSAETKEAANKAKDNANAELSNAEEGLLAATSAYSAASQEVDNATAEISAAYEKVNAADQKVKEAQADLDKATINTNKAADELTKAQEEADKLAKTVKQYSDTEDDLKAIQNQYYAMMIEYYRNSKTLGNKAVYNTDGTLNVEACAKAVTEAQIQDMANAPGDKVMYLGRDLMMKLITYIIENDENVDKSTANITFGNNDPKAKVVAKDSYEGKVFTSSDYARDLSGKTVYDENGKKILVDQVVTNQDSRKDKDGNEIKRNDPVTVNWEKDSDNGIHGRTNRLKVQYTDKDNNVHTEYYNYVFKSTNNGDTVQGVSTGPVYLAAIKTNEEGIKYVDPDQSANNFDNYKKLNNAITAISDLSKYNAAKEAVDNAAKKVQNLQIEIGQLKAKLATSNAALGEKKAELATLEKALKTAKDNLATATETKTALEATVQAARNAVNGIDITRFNTTETTNPSVTNPSGTNPSGTNPS